jgi:hypothetical protein
MQLSLSPGTCARFPIGDRSNVRCGPSAVTSAGARLYSTFLKPCAGGVFFEFASRKRLITQVLLARTLSSWLQP